MIKIVHIITGLGNGGAEHALFKICKYDLKNQHIVISLKNKGKYFLLLHKLGIEVYCLNISLFSIYKILSLVKLLSFLKPDLVQTWLVHADFFGSIAARLAGIKNILWNVRYSNFQIGKSKLTTILIVKFLSKLSYFIPKFILVVSKRAKKIYENKGYNKKILKFIPNGYDMSVLKINSIQNTTFRKKIKIKNDMPLIGNVARYDPQKDHLNLLKALAIICSKKIKFICIFVGLNMDNKNMKILSQIKKLKLKKHVKLIGQTNNISEVMNGLDIHILSSSYGEGFPNVVAEAMACGTPCVVTNVGDSAYIVGNTGWVVPPNDPKNLAKSILISLNKIKKTGWNKRCNKARIRIKNKFNIRKIIKLYNNVWIKTLKNN